MPSRDWARESRAAVLCLTFLVAACEEVHGRRAPAEEPASAKAPAATVEVATGSAPEGRGRESRIDGTCVATSKHAKHATMSMGCAVCHPCGGAVGFGSPVTLPGGTSTAGGTITPGSGSVPSTCTVACHYPRGGTPASISWGAQGPLACSGCHSSLPPGAVVRSKHVTPRPGDAVADRAECAKCHDTTGHPSGTIRVIGGDGTVVAVPISDPPGRSDPVCRDCHDGAGREVDGNTPALLVGWTAPQGDFHGARSGSGFGGTLAPPYVRGQGPLPCTACHDAHASGNAFLFAPVVNGSPVAAASIARTGVGAEQLCAKCHLGERHAGCADCHGYDPIPAGSACFFCHGHEGIVNFELPGGHDGTGGCSHCHNNSWTGQTDTQAPRVVISAAASDVRATRATITWTTDELSTSYVEWGTAELGAVTGTGALANQHSVTLSGLSELTTYRFRVRSSDPWRNLLRSAVDTFSTASVEAPPSPALDDMGYMTTPDTTITPTFTWSAVVDPQGDPVDYRFVLSRSPTFATLSEDSGWIAGRSREVTLAAPLWPAYDTYYWRVYARDVTHGVVSAPAATDSFEVAQYVDDWYLRGPSPVGPTSPR